MSPALPVGPGCPLCSSTSAECFYVLEQVPVTCTSIFDTAEEALAVPGGDIELCVCDECGFIFNRAFDQALGRIGAQYESSQAASAHFSEFAQSLAGQWVSRHGLEGGRVLEVGCGSGDFLKRMLDAGVHAAAGIDPLASPISSDYSNRVRLIAEEFHAAHFALAADALVCRHTLEHISDVAEFVKLLRQWAEGNPQSAILIEVPDAERVLAERAFWDVYYEHCNYFTAATLRLALELSGLEVTRLERVYANQYLIAEARLRETAHIDRTSPSAGQAVAACRAFASDVRAAIERGQAGLTRLAGSAAPVVLWQGAAKTVGLVTALPDAGVIKCAVDASPARHGKFLPGSALAVYAPDALRELRPGHIVLMNPVYLAEVRAQVCSLGLYTPVHSVNDLLRAG
ncbi:MAG: class I SAM-dependent methyltransferase [Steroidobacteraceae bacterium]